MSDPQKRFTGCTTSTTGGSCDTPCSTLAQQFRHARRQQRLTQQIWELTTDADLRTWDAGEHVIERAVALEALDSLPDTDVEALTLVTWHGLEAAEAASVVGCSPHAFTARLHRARKRLADTLRLAEQSREHLPVATTSPQGDIHELD